MLVGNDLKLLGSGQTFKIGREEVGDMVWHLGWCVECCCCNLEGLNGSVGGSEGRDAICSGHL